MKVGTPNAYTPPRVCDAIPDRFDCGFRALEPGWRPEPSGPDALAFQAGTRRGRRPRLRQSYGSRGWRRPRLERAEPEMVRTYAGPAAGLRAGELLLSPQL